MIKKIILGLLLGVVATLFMAQQDPYIQRLVAKAYADGFAQTYNCTMTYCLKNVSLLGARLELEDVCISPNNPEGWSLKAAGYSTGFSWFNIIAFGAIDMDIAVNGLQAQTTFDNGMFGIMNFFNKIIYGPAIAIPLDFKGITCHNSSLEIIDVAHNTTVNMHIDTQSHLVDEHFVTHASFSNGCCTYNRATVLTQLQGTITFDIGSDEKGVALLINTKGSTQVTHLEDPQCTFSFTWSLDHANGSITNISRTCYFEPITITPVDHNYILNYSGKIPLHLIALLISPHSIVSGYGMVRGLVNISNFSQGLAGTLIMRDILYHQIPIANECTVAYAYSNEQVKGGILLENAALGECKGSFIFHPSSQSCHAVLVNQSMIPVPLLSDWRIMPGEGQITFRSCEQDVDITSTVNIQAVYDSKKTITASTQCALSLLTNQSSLESVIGNYHVKGSGDERGFNFLTDTDKEKSVCTGAMTWQGKGDLSCNMPLVRELLSQWGYQIGATGRLNASFMYDNATIRTRINILQGTITAPQWFNPLTKFELDASIDTAQKKITAHQLLCGFAKGTIRSTNANIWYNDSYLPDYVQGGVMTEGLLINFKRDLFATVSGYTTLSKRSNEPLHARGTVFIERSQLKENLFSEEFQKSLFQSTEQLFVNSAPQLFADLTIESKDPVRIKTSLLEADAHLRLHVQHKDGASQISGLVQLTSGVIHFPYKPLHIVRGTLRFLPEQSFDPLIELIARNKIKKHHVSLLVTGSATNHQVLLESSPALTEEQIIGLLLVGMPEESLSIVMPAIIANNIKNVIFSSEQTRFGVNKYASQIGELLKHVHLVPRFADQTGRGGLRGAIEIDATDRLRALIQKNFSLSEDTRFEVEYAVTDDITLRGIRDERRDIAAEMEMRWKF